MENAIAICKHCGQEFTVPSYREYRFCSPRCVGLASAKKRWTRTPEQRYWDKVDQKGPEECWLWLAGRSKDGYGQIFWDGQCGVTATHVGWFLEHGEMPSLHVLHRCDHPWCHNPAHWFLGTKADNNRDRYQKGRYQKGHVDQKQQKLTWESVEEIRRSYTAGEMNQRQLSEKYGVSQVKISQIVLGKVWKPAAGLTLEPILKKPDRRGQKSSRRQLTDEQADEIRDRFASGSVSRKQLKEEYGISSSVLNPLLRGASYRPRAFYL